MDYNTVSLKELTRIENLPQSVEDVCTSKQLFTLKELIDYWGLHGTFCELEGHTHSMEIVLSSIAGKYALLPLLIKENVRGEESVPAFIQRINIPGKIILCQLIALAT